MTVTLGATARGAISTTAIVLIMQTTSAVHLTGLTALLVTLLMVCATAAATTRSATTMAAIVRRLRLRRRRRQRRRRIPIRTRIVRAVVRVGGSATVCATAHVIALSASTMAAIVRRRLQPPHRLRPLRGKRRSTIRSRQARARQASSSRTLRCARRPQHPLAWTTPRFQRRRTVQAGRWVVCTGPACQPCTCRPQGAVIARTRSIASA
jgi:hypothetical protein